jgi:hypothetical protein
MPSKQRNDEPTSSSILERVVRLEADSDHAEKDMGRFERRFSGLLEKLDKKIDDIPSEKSIRLIVTNEVHKAISRHMAKCKAVAGGMDWKAKTGMFVAVGTGLAALLKGLTG